MHDCEEEAGHIIIGEAAVQLIFNAEDVTLQALITTLREMAETQQDDLRVMAIYRARKWLSDFQPVIPATPRDWPQARLAETGTPALRNLSLCTIPDGKFS